MINIGVLAFQGSVEEHIDSLSKINGVHPVRVKTEEDLEKVSGLIIPGGESTTIGKLLREFSILEPLRKKIIKGLPVWGTCAGMVLLSKEIIGEDIIRIGTFNARVRRNAYGSQLDSFTTKTMIPDIANKEITLVFIRAPWIEEVYDGVKILAEIDGKIVAAKQDNILVTSFHPELTEELYFHSHFIELVKSCVNDKGYRVL